MRTITLDGESLVPLLKDSAAALKRPAIYQHFPGYLGAGKDSWRTTPVGLIQSGDWKLMEFYEDARLELYDLNKDPGESHNLVTEQPEKAKELHEQLKAWRIAVGAKMPTPNTGTPKKSTGKKGKIKGQGKNKGKEPVGLIPPGC